jgi:hypothetical protein
MARFRATAIGLMWGWLTAGLWVVPARGDGGTLRLWDRQGHYEIAVFTAPSPIVAGPVDISVLVLDFATGEPVLDANVLVKVAPHDRPEAAVLHPATSGAATNKLFYAALFDLDEPGSYRVEIVIAGPKQEARVRFDVEATNGSIRRSDLWPWIGWPAPVILLYGIHQWLVWRRIRPGRGTTESDSERRVRSTKYTKYTKKGKPVQGF